ncbi:MAG: lipid IV(A) 3-deoxy-D-manno-octulosonic acid transferase [Betaproteobacteria bacterium]|nr:lipid IV(A) 3-deoxy-D-manno-octulosonic acid transferase [Betaproteobacteria bacterium]
MPPMRILYSLAWFISLPFAFLYLLWRSRRQPEYRLHWGERLGLAPRLQGRVIWIHAVSVGETRAAAPLIHALRRRYPDHALLLTHMTPTGRATGKELYGDQVHQAYLPYDLPFLVARFLRRAQPALGVVMETELWPNLLAACAGRGVPMLLVNARLSEKSAAGYRRHGSLAGAALRNLTAIGAQTEADAARLRGLGAARVQVTGNLKFDVTAPADTPVRAADLRRLFAGRFVVLCASTREGEEALLLEHLARLPIPGLLLVVVPRHPQRFDEVAGLIQAAGLACVRRSAGAPVPPQTPVFLGDSRGEMAAYYAAADLAYVGGSLLPLGGQNLIEAAAAGCPALVGPHTWNFLEAAEQAVQQGAALRVADAETLARQVLALHGCAGERERMTQAGLAFAAANRGATERTMQMLEQALAEGGYKTAGASGSSL